MVYSSIYLALSGPVLPSSFVFNDFRDEDVEIIIGTTDDDRSTGLPRKGSLIQ